MLKMGSSPTNFCFNSPHPFFFFRFSHSPIHPNKFLKIYFIHFFFIKFWTILSKTFQPPVLTLNPSVQHFYFILFFSYVLFTKHTITQHIKIIVMHNIHTTHNNSSNDHMITRSHNIQLMLYTPSHIKHHACSVLFLSRDFLGNHIPNSNIEPPSGDVLTS